MSKNTYKLDNAATIFPTIIGKVAMAIWRVSATLKEKVEPQKLLDALNKTIIRFPCFKVKLRKGLFWYYFKNNDAPLMIHPEPKHPCVGMNYKRQNNGYLFAVKYFENRITVEGFHSLSDGYGGMVFLKNLVADYLRLSGYEIETDNDKQIYNLAQPAPQEECEDGYKKYYIKGLKPQKARKVKNKTIFHLCEGEKRHQLQNLIIGTMSTSAILELARFHGCTVGELLIAAHIFAMTKIRPKNDKGSIIECIPVNLRSFFPTQSMRNFSEIAYIEIDENREYSFDEILNKVQTQAKAQLKKEIIQAKFCANVALEYNPLIRIVPLLIKSKIIAAVYLAIGESGVTAALSNMGKIALPNSMAAHIDRFCVNTVAGYLNPKACGVISFEDKLCVSFASTVDNNELERLFFEFFSKKGIAVSIESNID